MAWYFSHAIFYVKVKDGEQDEFPVWENVYLIEAENDEDAICKAEQLAKEVEEDTKEVFYDDRPALQIFKGIRKIIGSGSNLRKIEFIHGEELTYSHFEVKSESDVERLANGEPVQIIHIE